MATIRLAAAADISIGNLDCTPTTPALTSAGLTDFNVGCMRGVGDQRAGRDPHTHGFRVLFRAEGYGMLHVRKRDSKPKCERLRCRFALQSLALIQFRTCLI